MAAAVTPLDPDVVQRFVATWIAAWNRHDLEAVMAMCDEDIEFVSSFLVSMYDEPSGRLHGKAALRRWFEASMNNDIHIEPPIHVLTGMDSAVLVEEISGTVAANVFTFGPDGLIVRSVVHG
jgi:ketosteroid isomerase-like protein